jgi:hypothetical protein
LESIVKVANAAPCTSAIGFPFRFLKCKG